MEFSDDRRWIDEDFRSSKAAVTLCLKDLSPDADLPAGSILQIQCITNVSVPKKAHSESRTEYDPRHHILKICLTDGKETVYGILYEPHLKLNTEIPPGTKVKAVRDIPFGFSRILKFSRSNVEVIGGHVEKLVEHWRVQKEHDKKSSWGKLVTGPGDEGPPKFKPMGSSGNSKALLGNIKELRNAKAMDILEEVKSKSDQAQSKAESKTDFDVQREEAISDLAKSSAKKAFSVSKQFPQAAPVLKSPPTKEDRPARRRPPAKLPEFDDRDSPKPRGRKEKEEEEELLSQYTYRGGQQNLKDHFSSFFNNGLKAPETERREHYRLEQHGRNPEQERLSSSFGRMDLEDRNPSHFPDSRVFHRGGGEYRRGSSRGDGGQRRSRGGRGPGRGRGSGRARGSYSDYQQPQQPRPSSSYVPDLSSFPSLG